MNKDETQLAPTATEAPPEPTPRVNVAGAVITTIIWAAIGATFGRMLGGAGDVVKIGARDVAKGGAGALVGTWVGGITGGAIAFGTSLKIIGQNKEKHKDLRFPEYEQIPARVPEMAMQIADPVMRPETRVNGIQPQGALMDMAPEQTR